MWPCYAFGTYDKNKKQGKSVKRLYNSRQMTMMVSNNRAKVASTTAQKHGGYLEQRNKKAFEDHAF
jgi:hypothetical protein